MALSATTGKIKKEEGKWLRRGDAQYLSDANFIGLQLVHFFQLCHADIVFRGNARQRIATGNTVFSNLIPLLTLPG